MKQAAKNIKPPARRGCPQKAQPLEWGKYDDRINALYDKLSRYGGYAAAAEAEKGVRVALSLDEKYGLWTAKEMEKPYLLLTLSNIATKGGDDAAEMAVEKLFSFFVNDWHKGPEKSKKRKEYANFLNNSEDVGNALALAASMGSEGQPVRYAALQLPGILEPWLIVETLRLIGDIHGILGDKATGEAAFEICTIASARGHNFNLTEEQMRALITHMWYKSESGKMPVRARDGKLQWLPEQNI